MLQTLQTIEITNIRQQKATALLAKFDGVFGVPRENCQTEFKVKKHKSNT